MLRGNYGYPFPTGKNQLVVGAGGMGTPFTGVFGGGNILLIPATLTFIVPSNVRAIRARGWAGGGSASGGTKGGGGGFFLKTITGLTPGQSIVCTVGGIGGSTSVGAFASATGGSTGGGGSGTGGDINSNGNPLGATGNIFGVGGRASGNGGKALHYGGPGYVGQPGLVAPSGTNTPGLPGQMGSGICIDLLGCGPGGSGGFYTGALNADGADGVNGGGGGDAGAGSASATNGGNGGYPGGGGGCAVNAGVDGVGAAGLIILEW